MEDGEQREHADRDAAMARRAGAKIIVSPHTDLQVIEYANENDMLCVAGASTPTEIIRAWEAGCDIVKVYPAHYLGGPDYIRTIRGPIRDVLMLAGGRLRDDLPASMFFSEPGSEAARRFLRGELIV